MRKLTFFIVFSFLFTSYLSYSFFLEPVEGKEEVDFIVKRGETAYSVAERLREAGIIRYPELFRILAILTGKDKKIKSGRYTLKKGLSELRVLWAMTRENAGVQEVIVTIPEGYTLKDIAQLLHYKLLIDEDKFLTLAADKVFIRKLALKYPLLDHPPTLEGYLFPDTYKLYWGISEEEIIDVMVRRLFELWTPAFTARAESLGMTVHQILTLASIIEKEAMVDWEKPLIAGVFYNRLKRGQPLESCATVEYLLPEHKTILTYEDLQIDSPYNTYKYAGLPPGPICSPGLMSIKAALYPAKTQYLYFVAKGDGTHFFAKTWRQHLLNKARARVIWRKKGLLN